MASGELGLKYEDDTVIFHEGEPGNCMYYISSGKVRISKNSPEGEVHIATLPEGEIFGEMALFDQLPRSATATAVGNTRLLTIDKKKFIKSVSRDPSLAFTILEAMSKRTRRLNEEFTKTRSRKFEALKASLDIEQVSTLILDEARHAVEADNGSIMLLENDGKTLAIVSAFGEEHPDKMELKVGDGVAGKVLETGQAQMINNVSVSPLYKPGGQAINSIVCVPLIAEDKKLGVLNLSSVTDKIFSMHDMKLIQVLTSYSAIAIQSALGFEELKRTMDSLTIAVQKLSS